MTPQDTTTSKAPRRRRRAESQPGSITTLITDRRAPLQARIDMLRQVAVADGDQATEILGSLVEAATSGSSGANLDERLAEVEQLLEQMRAGPMRSALFLELRELPGLGLRAHVVLSDGSQAFCVVPDEALAADLRRGDRVWLEAQARALLLRDSEQQDIGEEARLERRHGASVEVTLRNDERAMFHASDRLLSALDAGEAEPGSSLVVCSGSRVALGAVPREDGLAHLRYLSRREVPDVDIERDVGAPPAFLKTFESHLRTELEQPELARRYRLPRCRTVLLTGVSGSGKTLSIHAWWRRMVELCAAHTGLPVDELPPRVFLMRTSEMLSQWLGVSDKNVDRFFDEVEELAGRPWVDPRGVAHDLPVLVVIEEIDGMARTRGEDSIHDRIQTTLLQRLDATARALKDKLLYVLCTTNVPHAVDPAILRRVGGRTESFGRLGRAAFRSVLGKHLRDRPFREAANGCHPAVRCAAELEAWLFNRSGEVPGLVEISYAGTTTPDVRYHRDFLTGGLVDRSVQQAAEEAARAEREGVVCPGLDARRIQAALDEQVRAIVDQLRPENAHHHLTLPDGARPTTVRRIPQPEITPAELERVG